MDRPQLSRTGVTLLGRLHQNPNDQEAWNQFVERYGPKTYRWCLKWGLQPADADDVTQDVLLKLAKRMNAFTYDSAGSFHALLKLMTDQAVHDHFAERRRGVAGSGDTQELERLQSQEARQDLHARLAEEYDLELLQIAEERTRLVVGPQKWQAYCLMEKEGLSGAETAARLGMPVATAFTACSKARAQLKAEVRKLQTNEALS
jgi:RNA polymerase sigma factor (sigma-70 family)